MSKIPTAEELCKKYTRLKSAVAIQDLTECMNEYAKLHVKAALKAAAKNVRTTCLADKFLDAYDPSKDAEGDVFTKDSILDAYPENLIV